MTRIPTRIHQPSVQHIPVVMKDGTTYEIHPMGSNPRRGPLHRIYLRSYSARLGKITLTRIEDEPTMELVAARLLEMQREAKRDLWREKYFGKRLVRMWRWVMVFIDKMRVEMRRRASARPKRGPSQPDSSYWY